MNRPFRAEREFGLIVGAILFLLGAWWLYRGKFAPVAQLTVALGMLLVLLGLIWPRALTYPNKAWMWLAVALSFVTTPVVIGIIFFLVVTPIGYVKRLLGWDPLRRRSGPSVSYWRPYSPRQSDPRHYEKMF